MFKIIAVTNRKLCKGSFLGQIEKLCVNPRISSIVLREKDLTEEEYETLAKKAISICNEHEKELILHNFVDTAIKLEFPNIHLSVRALEQNADKLDKFKKTGVSVHSAEDVKIANKYGANYVFAGHIFATDCKKGLPPRGTGFLREIVGIADCPVYAIGGVNKTNLSQIKEAGALGACIMSGAMAETIDI